MKKLLLLFMSVATLTACSKDDDDNKDSQDPILGVWYVASIQNGGNFQLSECNKESSVEFMENNNGISKFYSESNGECNLDNTEEGEWSNLGSSRYKFVIPYEGIGAQSGKVEFNGDSEFTFYPDILASNNTSIVFEKR